MIPSAYHSFPHSANSKYRACSHHCNHHQYSYCHRVSQCPGSSSSGLIRSREVTRMAIYKETLNGNWLKPQAWIKIGWELAKASHMDKIGWQLAKASGMDRHPYSREVISKGVATAQGKPSAYSPRKDSDHVLALMVCRCGTHPQGAPEHLRNAPH